MSALLSMLGRLSTLLRPRKHAPGMQNAKCAGVASWALTHSRYIWVIAWVNIVFQLLFPVTLAFTPAIVAAKQADLSEQMSALQGGLGERPESAPVFVPPDETVPSSLLSPSSAPSSLSPSSLTPLSPSSLSPSSAPTRAIDLPDLGSGAADKATGSADTAEPDAVRQARERQETLDNRMNAAQQLWGVLGGPSLRDQGLDRATGIASGLANQAAEDWLKQYGNARLSFSTQGIGSLDLLAPLWESNADLFYTQLGGRRDSDRTTTNVGLGWRSFTSDWMLGVNAFYDYDMTGKNKRAGVGIEAWRDYLKLSANSYLRLTDWHQSVLSEMQDYDERPANGFDVRAEAYLPAYPQLGGKLMYEQYQGKGVSLTGSTSDLQDNPSAVTVGLNYTPVPLIKVGVEHKNGSGVSDTALTLDFSYRFGTPWIEQINPESVAFTRSLAGSRYDLVDRNNSIVMQYRKQDLISLLLNVMGTPYAGERVIVTANVTSKYGLDHMVWDAPALLAAGGKLTPQSVNTVEVLMPAITTAVPMRARAAASDRYELGGIAYDTHGNASPRATVSLVSVRSPQDIGSLSVTKDKSVANGVDENTVQITTVDTQSGSGLANAEVALTFTHTNGTVLSTQTVTTDAQGQAVVNLASTLAGAVSVKALLKSNNNAASTTMSFVADSATAHIAEGSLTVVRDNALADGNSTNAVKAVVTDAQGNPVSGMSVDLSATNGAVLSVAQVTTNDNGEVAATLKSTRAGVSTVTATVNGQSAQVNTTFLAGKPQVANSSFSATPSTIVADGRSSSALQLTLNDGNGNPVSLTASQVSLQVGGVSGTTLSALSGQDGVYTASLSGIKAGEAVITPRVEGSDLSGLAQRVTLTADGSSAQLPDGALTVTQNNAVADDTATNKVQAVVTDANGNPVSGVPVVFSATAPAHITVSDYATDANGIATATLASPVQGSVAVSAEANGSRRQVNVTFAALQLVVKATDITGKLEVGQLLEGQYTFSTNGSDKTDNSTFAWSNGGQSNVTTQTYNLNTSDVGKVLTFSVTAKNGAGITGNTDSISTQDAPGTGGSGSGDNPGEVIDPTIAPAAKDLDISGKLEVGQTLTGSYTFVANGGDTTDKSTLAWSSGGQSGVTTKTYGLNGSDVGKILTFTVTPKNGKSIVGTAVSINTQDATGTTGGDGNNPGGIIDPNVKPIAKNLNIMGKLESGATLTGSYTFNPNGGDTTDKSTLLWTDGGQSGITTTTYTLNGSDVGKILTFTVTPINGKAVQGTPVSINTKDAAGTGGSGSGENPGEVIDPTIAPAAKDLDISGKLEVGQTLTGSYTFVANGGDTTDKSTLAWSNGGQSGVTTKTYGLNGSDVGKILTFTVTPINGKAVQGDDVSINTKDAAGVSGGDGNHPGEIINPGAVPVAENLDIIGKLEVGQTLTGSYTFNPNGGDTTDASTFNWNGAGTPSTQTTYGIASGDVGKVLTFTVTPINGKAVQGTPVSINTTDATGTTGGDGGNKGEIIDPAAKPIVTADDITGKLAVGSTLTGVYTFAANGGDSRDVSTFAWSDGGQSGITTTSYSLNTSDIGKVLTFSVTAVNGAGVTGNTDSLSTKDAGGVTDGDTNHLGAVVDPAATPSASNLNITGKLEVGQTLTGSYTFNPNGGDTTDASTFNWDGAGTPSTQTTYGIVSGDVGKVLTFTVTPINGKAVQGTPVSISTQDATGVTGGDGDPGHKGEIIDPTAKPIVTADDITGKLEVGQTLTGAYTFSPNGGDSRDASTFAWSNGGQSGVTATTYNLNTSDIGKVLTFSVTAVNGAGVTGNTDSISTKDAGGTTGGDTDNKGEVIDPAVPSAKHSLLSANPLSITADGTASSTLTFEAKNAGNEAITGLGNNVVFANTGITATLSAVTENAAGVYTATLTGTQAGMAIVSVSVDGTAVNVLPVQIALTAGAIDTAHSDLTATPDSIVANNGLTTAGQSVVTLTLKDTQDNPVTGLTDVVLTVAGVTDTTLTTVTESPAGSGVYTATLSGTTAGTATVTASAGGAALTGLQAQVTLNADITTATVTTVTETTAGAKADNVSTNTLTATVKDANGNPVPNATVDWSVTTGIATLSGATSETDSSGVATMTVKDTTAETATITAKVGSNAADGGQTVDTTFSLYPVVSGITQGVNNSPADNTTANTLVIQVSDLANNPLAGQEVTLQVSSTGSATLKYKGTSIVGTTGGTITDTTDSNGQLTLQATDITAETITVNAKVNTSTQVAQKRDSTFTVYPILNAADMSVPLEGAPSDAASLNTVQVIVRDLKGNALSGQTVSWTVSSPSGKALFSPAAATTATSTSNASGMATISLTDRRREGVPVTAKVGAGTAAQTQSKATTFMQYANLTITSLGNNNCGVPCTVTVNVNAKDIDGNPLAGLMVGSQSPTYGGGSTGFTLPATDGSGNAAIQRPMTVAAVDTGVYVFADAAHNAGIISPTRSGAFTSEYRSATTTVTTTLNPVSITSVSPVINPYTFAANSGFPKTGFAGAKFKITLSDNNPTAYQWAVDGSINGTAYTSVGPEGIVTLNNGHSGAQTVQVKDKTTGSVLLSYTFAQVAWYIHGDTTHSNWGAGNNQCYETHRASMARTDELVNVLGGPSGARLVGPLYSEWGPMGNQGSGFTNDVYWTSMQARPGTAYTADLGSGSLSSQAVAVLNRVVCVQDLRI